MPDNKHYRKWILQMPAGFLFVAVGILVIMYANNARSTDDWLLWGILSVTIINSGLALLGNALVHKIKSDLIQKSKPKKNQLVVDDE